MCLKKLFVYFKGYGRECVLGPLFKLLEASFELIIPLIVASIIDRGIASGDGRSRNDPTKRYGTGGQLHDKRYLISSTWNAPLEAFTDPDQFFEGRGIDGLFMPLHKTFEFIGMRKLPSFMVNDVFKHPTIPEDLERWKAHLTKLFG